MRIFVSAPYRGNVEANKLRAADYARRVFEAGHESVLPHYMFEWTLHFYPPHAANVIALYLCCKALRFCDEVWTFGGDPSDGMMFETTYARGLNIPVKDGESELRREHGPQG